MAPVPRPSDLIGGARRFPPPSDAGEDRNAGSAVRRARGSAHYHRRRAGSCRSMALALETAEIPHPYTLVTTTQPSTPATGCAVAPMPAEPLEREGLIGIVPARFG